MPQTAANAVAWGSYILHVFDVATSERTHAKQHRIRRFKSQPVSCRNGSRQR